MPTSFNHLDLQVADIIDSSISPHWDAVIKKNENLVISIFGGRDIPNDRELIAEVIFDETNKFLLILCKMDHTIKFLITQDILLHLYLSDLDLNVYQYYLPPKKEKA
jgi:hypothetical protein